MDRTDIYRTNAHCSMQDKIGEASIRGQRICARRGDADVLHSATLAGQTNLILCLLENGTDVNTRSKSHWTALHVASAHGHPETVLLLLRRGADINATTDKGITALHLAAKSGNNEVVRLLLQHGLNHNLRTPSEAFTALHLAAVSGRTAVLETLIEHHADLEARAFYGNTALHCAAREGHVDCVVQLAGAGADIDTRGDPEQETPLMTAAVQDNNIMVQTLLDLGADVDATQRHGRTATLAAAYYGNLEALQALIAGGANLDMMDHKGYTPLRCAIDWKHPKAALVLLEQRVRVNTPFAPHNDTALHLAVRHDYLKVVKKLLSKGVDVEACDADGDRPLQWAVQLGKVKMVKCLLRHGAKVRERNSDTGETVLHWAVKCGHVAVTELLLSCGSDASLVNRSIIQKLDEVDDEDFETCMILVETCNDIRQPGHLPLDEISSASSEEESGERQLSTLHETRKGSKIEDTIKCDIYDVPDQLSMEGIEHDGVVCDGPLCKQSTTNIKGIRYKCTVCDNIDFCSACITSFHNNHDVRHAMIKCLLPTTFRTVREIDDIAKKELLLSSGQPLSKVDDLSHVVYAETNQKSLLQHQATSAAPLVTSTAIEESTQAMFVIVRSRSPKPGLAKRKIIREGDVDNMEAVSWYKVDESGQVRVKYQSIGTASIGYREEGLVKHHQDADLLSKVMLGQLRYYIYPDSKGMSLLACESRLPTRLIDLKPGDFGDKIEIDIRLVDMADAPRYEALSWTWKETAYERAHHESWTREVDEEFRKMVKLNHAVYCHEDDGRESFPEISGSLRDALQRLRNKKETTTFWIDQLSINQNNVHERAFQVSAMRVFYNRAQQVTVWTGDEDENTNSVFDMFRKIAEASRLLGYLPGPDELLPDAILDLPPADSSLWRSACSYFLRPVFGRCWVIQEIVVAQKVCVRCGNYSITWQDLSQAVKVLCQGPWIEVLPWVDYDCKAFFESPSPPQASSFTLPRICIIGGIRDDFQTLREMPLENLLYMTGVFGATDPRDRIYSLLGILSARTNPNSSLDIKPDYEESVSDVFTQATKAVILNSGSLNICGMHRSMSEKSIEGLPSWVPDYSATIASVASSYSRPQPSNPYSASGDSGLVAAWPHEQQKTALVTTSCCVDTITSVAQQSFSKDADLGAVFQEWTNLATQGPNYVSGEFAADAFWRTCVGDATLSFRQSPAPASYHLPLSVFIGRCFLQHLRSIAPDALGDAATLSALDIHCNKLIGTLMNDAFEGAPNWAEEPLDYLDPGAVPALFGACRNRKFFVTANQYFGVGPADAQVCDEIHILAGTRVPFVLRKVATSDSRGTSTLTNEAAAEGCYIMVGETYVHGIMKGEALKRDSFEWGEIRIC